MPQCPQDLPSKQQLHLGCAQLQGSARLCLETTSGHANVNDVIPRGKNHSFTPVMAQPSLFQPTVVSCTLGGTPVIPLIGQDIIHECCVTGAGLNDIHSPVCW